MAAELGAWLAEPRTNEEIRERVRRYEGVDERAVDADHLRPHLLPLVQLPPAGHWDDRRRPSFVVDPRPLPDPADAATLVLARYLAAFGPASRRDVAAWAGRRPARLRRGVGAPGDGRVPRRAGHGAVRPPRAAAAARLDAAAPAAARPLGPAAARLRRPRAHHRRPRCSRCKLTLSGDPTVTVDGRVAASWAVEREGDAVRLTVTPHVEIRRAARAAIRAEAKRTARFCEPDARRVEVAGV